MAIVAEGRDALVRLISPANGKLNIVGAALRRVVFAALSAETPEPPVDLLKVGWA